MAKKKPEDSAAASMLRGLLESLGSQTIPTGDSFGDCLARAALHLFHEYEQKDTPLTEAVDRLVLAFSNQNDPFVASLGFMERTAAAMWLKRIRVQREKRRLAEAEKKLV